MKITFIKPNIGRLEHSLYVDEGRMEPLQLGVLAGLTPPDAECVLYDDRIEAIPYDEPTDLVAITVEIYTARRAYEIAEEFRLRGVKVILGGFHPTLVPDECRQYADSIFVGDAELIWRDVVEDARRGRLRPEYRSPPGIPQPGGVQPRRELFRGKRYLPVTLMQFGRGCRFSCDFCAISVFFNRRNYVRRTREVLDEIANQERKFIFFVDDNFLSDQQAAKAFLRELIPLRIRWVSQASLDMTNDLELMRLLVDSGCLGNVIGFESLDPANLRQMKKAPNLLRGRGEKPLRAGSSSARSSPANLGGVYARSRSRHAAVDSRDQRFRDAPSLLFCGVQHPHALSRHAALHATAQRRAPALRRPLVVASGVPLQPCRVCAPPHDARRAHRSLLGMPPKMEHAEIDLLARVGFQDASQLADTPGRLLAIQSNLRARGV
jgi:hypothetical protein